MSKGKTQIEELRAQGMYGDTKELTWNGDCHTCCGSVRSYYHKSNCPSVTGRPSLRRGSMNKIQSMVDPISGNEIRFNLHAKRKNNIKVSAMYAMYKTGRSLEAVAKIYGVTRQSVYDIFRTRGYQLRSKQMNGLQILDGHQFSLMKGGYLRGTVEGKRILMHHYVWKKYKGDIPQEHCIFHIDRNKENNSIENLDIVAKNMMVYKFNPTGINQFTKK